MHIDQYQGCFLGLALGDTLGAPYEGGPLERLLWKSIGKTKDGKLRYTDDTQMSIDIAASFLKHNAISQDHLARLPLPRTTNGLEVTALLRLSF